MGSYLKVTRVVVLHDSHAVLQCD